MAGSGEVFLAPCYCQTHFVITDAQIELANKIEDVNLNLPHPTIYGHGGERKLERGGDWSCLLAALPTTFITFKLII